MSFPTPLVTLYIFLSWNREEMEQNKCARAIRKMSFYTRGGKISQQPNGRSGNLVPVWIWYFSLSHTCISTPCSVAPSQKSADQSHHNIPNSCCLWKRNLETFITKKQQQRNNNETQKAKEIHMWNDTTYMRRFWRKMWRILRWCYLLWSIWKDFLATKMLLRADEVSHALQKQIWRGHTNHSQITTWWKCQNRIACFSSSYQKLIDDNSNHVEPTLYGYFHFFFPLYCIVFWKYANVKYSYRYTCCPTN